MLSLTCQKAAKEVMLYVSGMRTHQRDGSGKGGKDGRANAQEHSPGNPSRRTAGTAEPLTKATQETVPGATHGATAGGTPEDPSANKRAHRAAIFLGTQPRY